MTDCELLELAAKAAEINVGDGPSGMWLDSTYPCLVNGNGASWSPLTDDGDALRLAVKLNINPQQYPIYLKEKHSVIAVMHLDLENDISGIATYQECGNDPYAATRRAIVRAAAEIGKEMK